MNSINRDVNFNYFLSTKRIIWELNLSRVPWWGGQYERLIGFKKYSLYKSIGKSLLTWSELEVVLLDVRVNLNNRPSTYIEEDLEHSVLTPNSMILRRDIKFSYYYPEEEAVSKNWKKRQIYVHKCKEVTSKI